MIHQLFLSNIILFVFMAFLLGTEAPGFEKPNRWPDGLKAPVALWLVFSTFSIPCYLIYLVWTA